MDLINLTCYEALGRWHWQVRIVERPMAHMGEDQHLESRLAGSGTLPGSAEQPTRADVLALLGEALLDLAYER